MRRIAHPCCAPWLRLRGGRPPCSCQPGLCLTPLPDTITTKPPHAAAAAGGTLGDRLARRFPNSPNGRILTNQASVLIGLPLSFLLLKGARGWRRTPVLCPACFLLPRPAMRAGGCSAARLVVLDPGE
jgi:hypothetical protein